MKKEKFNHNFRVIFYTAFCFACLFITDNFLSYFAQVEGLVMVGSTRANLRSLAVAAAAGRPVLLQGPVGCGKTALVEHLAALTGARKIC